MNQSDQREPEFILEALEETSQEWVHGRTSNQTYKDQVQVKSRQLYKALTILVGTLDAIRDSVRELEQLRVEQR